MVILESSLNTFKEAREFPYIHVNSALVELHACVMLGDVTRTTSTLAELLLWDAAALCSELQRRFWLLKIKHM